MSKPTVRCARCEKIFTPKVKGDTICQSCLPIVIENKNRNCTDHINKPKINEKSVQFRQGPDAVTDSPLFRGQQKAATNIVPRNPGETAGQARHVASNSQGGSRNSSWISFTNDLTIAQQYANGQHDEGSGIVVFADANQLKNNPNCTVSDVSTHNKAEKAFPVGGDDPRVIASARKNGVSSKEVSVKTDEEGIEVRPGVIGVQHKVTSSMISSTLPTSKGIEVNRINGRGETKEPSIVPPGSHVTAAVVKAPAAHCSASGGICDIIDRWDTKAYAEGDTLHAFSGVITTKTRKIATASAGVASWSAGTAKGIASVNASVATASATASFGYDGASAFANASLVSVGAQLGPVNARAGLDLTSGASIGWGGIDVSVLGFGVSLGPKLGVSLPFFSFSVGL
jgi:hypothetical protein